MNVSISSITPSCHLICSPSSQPEPEPTSHLSEGEGTGQAFQTSLTLRTRPAANLLADPVQATHLSGASMAPWRHAAQAGWCLISLPARPPVTLPTGDLNSGPHHSWGILQNARILFYFFRKETENDQLPEPCSSPTDSGSTRR